MAKFRKKPVVIEAFKWTGDQIQDEDPEWAVEAIHGGKIHIENKGTPDVCLMIDTLEGAMTANLGDWIIRGVKGELYPCKPDIFEQTYDVVEEPPERDVAEAGITCESRKQQGGQWAEETGKDSWLKTGEDRCCSFCGSLHPEDFLALLKQSADPESKTWVDRSDKSYKYYVTRPGVPTAREGGIKFYTWHAGDLAKELEEATGPALHEGRKKFQKAIRGATE